MCGKMQLDLKTNMPSLYHHEQLAHSYADTPDEVLAAYSLELQEISERTDIPRQKEVIKRLLGFIAFEAEQRLIEASGTVRS